MNAKEQQLEELTKLVDEHEATKFPPLFEMFVTIFSILTSILLFWFPKMLHPSDASFYDVLLQIMPQHLWALAFFGAGITKAVGLIIDNNNLRVIGLLMSTALYFVFTICYAVNFPTIGALNFACITVFSIISIAVVRHTGLTIKKRGVRR